MSGQVENSFAVRLVLSDGIVEHTLDSGTRLTRTELKELGGFDQLKADLKRLIEAYRAA
jgi:hypothetical protein